MTNEYNQVLLEVGRWVQVSQGVNPFGEGEIQGLFQDFQGPFLSKFKDLELGEIFENGMDFRL
jgi:hypothetical protein